MHSGVTRTQSGGRKPPFFVGLFALTARLSLVSWWRSVDFGVALQAELHWISTGADSPTGNDPLPRSKPGSLASPDAPLLRPFNSCVTNAGRRPRAGRDHSTSGGMKAGAIVAAGSELYSRPLYGGNVVSGVRYTYRCRRNSNANRFRATTMNSSSGMALRLSDATQHFCPSRNPTTGSGPPETTRPCPWKNECTQSST
jgi:hypothetical protein